jgi:putative transposase
VSPIDRRLKQIIRETCAAAPSELIEMEVMPDYVHLLLDCDPQFGINRLVRSIKGRSSHILRSEYPALKSRLPSLWTGSYFCASVGRAPPSVIRQYIEYQKGV